MNGFISSQRLRLTLSLTTCLLGGFHYGMNHGDRFDFIKLDRQLNLSSVSWVLQEFKSSKIQNPTNEYPKKSILELNAKRFDDLKQASVRRVVSNSSVKKNNIRELAKAIDRVSHPDTFEEMKKATEEMHHNVVASLDQNSKADLDKVVISASSAQGQDQLLDVNMKIDLARPDQILALNDFEVSDSLGIQMMNTQIDESGTSIDTKNKETVSVENEVGRDLENQYLNQYVESQNLVKKQESELSIAKQIEPADMDKNDGETEAFNTTIVQKTSGCQDISDFKLMKPMDLINSENIQNCPTEKTWLSKNFKGAGWVKMELEGHFPIVAHYPQPHSQQILMMDENSVALLAIKSGSHFSKESGMVMGTIPNGYRVEFSGKTEDVQSIEINSQKYFFLMNVDPGAGVIELVSETNPQETSSVFVPVLKGAISYMSLSAPVKTDISVQIHKPGKTKKELEGLTVSLSAQTLSHGLTDKDGKTTLKDVLLVTGYPVHLDVTSKYKDSKGYQYRYEIGTNGKDGALHLKQFSEIQIQKWVSQYQGKLDNQSALIIGNYDRRKMGGFKNHYFAKASPLTETNGLKQKTYSILWDDHLSEQEPLEGDQPRFMTLQASEGLTQLNIVNENNKTVSSNLIPVSPRVINVITE